MSSARAVGKVTRLFGPDGTLAVVLYDEFPDADLDYEEPLFAIVDSLAVPLFLERFERRGRSGAVVRFSDLESSAQAAVLLGRELYAADPTSGDSAACRPEFGDLAGYRAVLSPTVEGVVTGMAGEQSNPLITVDVAGREVLVPAVDELVADIDDAARTVRFELPDGLLELYLD